MTRRDPHPSIVRKLTLVTTLVSGAALVLAGLAFGAYDRTTSRSALITNLSIQAQIVASNSISALLFDDANAAKETLAALAVAPNIVAAEIDGEDGHSLAMFDRESTGHASFRLGIPAGRNEAFQFGDREITLTRPIVFQGKTVGTVSIVSDYASLNSRRNQYIVTVAAVSLVSVLAAWLMSWFSQRSISEPIVSLAATAHAVSSDKDYSVRASVAGSARELVVLTDAFNDMLSQIEVRDHSLRQAQDELEQRVAQRTAELDTVNKELEAFTYSVSHDLRAPLRHVVGFAGLLGDRARDGLDEQSRRYLRTLTVAAQQMGQLIDDLLAFSRMGRGQIVKRRVNLNALVREAQQQVVAQGNVAARHIEWRIADLPEVDADPAMLRLVLINLLSNAVKYTGRRDETRIDVGLDGCTADEIVVFVRDNGVGFDMQYAHKLFGVFQRLHSSDDFEGTGIGLANVKRIIARHGGRVWAESELDHGAAFFFSLPVKG